MNPKLILVGVVVFLVFGSLVVWSITARQPKSVPANSNDQQMTNPPSISTNDLTAQPVTQELLWQQSEGGWQSVGTPPACPDQPMMISPVDVSKATAILYPGQTRGGNYKPHGGFRFDDSQNDEITITAPVEGYLVRGSRYLEMGEVQYSFDVMNNCGVMYRFDHLRLLPDNLQTIANTWPEPIDGDSRSQPINPPVFIKQGEVLATSVGFIKSGNASVDWGVYDFRSENEASQSSIYQSAHQADRELSWHAVCWFDWLLSDYSMVVKGLPSGDGGSGKTSDYCK